jgi:hypothetical protein
MKRKALLINGFGVTSIGLFFGGILTLDLGLMIPLTLLLLALIFIGYQQELSIITPYYRERKYNSVGTNFYLRLLLNNKKVWLPLVIGFILKTVILLVDLYLVKSKGTHLFDGGVFFWLFASPLIVFTYIFNNTWGFWKNIWLNIELRSGQYKDLVLMSLKLMLAPLILDMLITLPILLFSRDNIEFIFLFYFTTTIYLLFFSFLWTLITPRAIHTSFQMKGSTSPIANITAMLGVFLLTLMDINGWFYLLSPLMMIIAFVAFRFSVDRYKDKKYLLTEKLMKK